MRSDRRKIKTADAVRAIKTMSMSPEGIICLLDDIGMDDAILSALKPLLNDPKHRKVRDVILSLDLLPSEIENIAESLNGMESNEVTLLMLNLKMSRPEITYVVKMGLISDDDLTKVTCNVCDEHLARVILRWRPRMLKDPNIGQKLLNKLGEDEVHKALDESNDSMKLRFLGGTDA